MFDSESRLREAIQKMLEVQKKGSSTGHEGHTEKKADDLDMSNMTMEDTPGAPEPDKR
jgi:hypothetical protein